MHDADANRFSIGEIDIMDARGSGPAIRSSTSTTCASAQLGPRDVPHHGYRDLKPEDSAPMTTRSIRMRSSGVMTLSHSLLATGDWPPGRPLSPPLRYAASPQTRSAWSHREKDGADVSTLGVTFKCKHRADEYLLRPPTSTSTSRYCPCETSIICSIYVSIPSMPTRTPRQQAADALYQAFLVDLIANVEAEAWDDGDESDDSESSSSSSSSSWSSSSSSSSGSDDEPTPAERYVESMGDLYSQRYLADRRDIPKTDDLLTLLLTDYKTDFPDIFRSYLRIDPACFDDLLAAIKDDDVFQNNSNNPQMPVAQQLVIALYRFGHYGNAASTMKVALQFGVGFGTIHLVTTRVIKATCSERFRAASVQWASREAKETAKQWVGEVSCPAWRNGWLMVDGTLVPLFRRPGQLLSALLDACEEVISQMGLELGLESGLRGHSGQEDDEALETVVTIPDLCSNSD
ncbi:hypothetical protein FB451DRAFT_1190265 [Mycena latifolia]|nr:hypothetical protein FB451DRAFT_1190265 [Mycena latifolia]